MPRIRGIERHARELGLSLWDAVQGVVDDRGLSTPRWNPISGSATSP